MNIVEWFQEEMATDDESSEKKDDQLEQLWEEADKQEKAVINKVFTVLCGYSFETLKQKVAECED